MEGKYDEALECFDNTLKIDSENIMAWMNEGYIFLQNFKDYHKCIKMVSPYFIKLYCTTSKIL